MDEGYRQGNGDFGTQPRRGLEIMLPGIVGIALFDTPFFFWFARLMPRVAFIVVYSLSFMKV